MTTPQGSEIQSPADLEGKSVGVVGLESYHQVMVQRWMEENDADYSTVRFVEVAFPQMQDLLSSGNVDAVVSVDPFFSRMINEGIGYTFGDFVETMPDGVPIVVFVSLREWAESNPDKVTAFREALIEANQFIQDNEDEARRSLAKWTNLPEPVVATSRWGRFYAETTEEGIGYWVELMRGQGLIDGDLERTKRVLERVQVFTLAESLGGVESLVAHPASMTHAAMDPEARRVAGIGDSLLRLSVGIEAAEDLVADVQAGLARAERAAARPRVVAAG